METSPIPGTPILKNKRAIAVAAICLIYSLITITRNADWKDNYTLFQADLKKSANDCELYFYLATEISQNRYPEETNPSAKLEMDKESIGYLNKAITIYPDFEASHIELGRIYERLQMYDSAIAHDKRALEINPTHTIALYNLARAYYFLKNYPEAIEYFKKTLAIQPDILFAHLNLAACYSDFKQYDSAIVYFNKTLELDPGQQIAKQGLAYAINMKNKTDTVNKK